MPIEPIMPKPLLALLLMMTQLLPWSGAPAYLCVESDGSICIDFGSASCDCCHSECPTASDVANENNGWSFERLPELSAGASLDCADCDCIHIQISRPQTPIVSPATAAQSNRLVVAYASPAFLLNTDCSTPDAAWLSRPLSSLVPLPQARRLSVVLRC